MMALLRSWGHDLTSSGACERREPSTCAGSGCRPLSSGAAVDGRASDSSCAAVDVLNPWAA